MNNQITTLSGMIVDVLQDTIFPGTIAIQNNKIISIERRTCAPNQYILPGFVDAHVHIESSLVPPYEFARIAASHGVIAALVDPHEIANVMGISGMRYMTENGKTAPISFFWGAPSCVPATPFETTGAHLDAEKICCLLEEPEITFLAEVMNYQAVLEHEPDIMRKVSCAQRLNKPIDGHCPGLTGQKLKDYIAAGISTDHESIDYYEAREKIEQGMMIHIRSGSAADNLPALAPLISQFPDSCMLCSDDINTKDLLIGSINRLVKRSTDLGCKLMPLLKAAHLNAKRHYTLPIGSLQHGDPADLIIVDSLTNFNVIKAYAQGSLVAENKSDTSKQQILPFKKASIINNFQASPISQEMLNTPLPDTITAIGVTDNELITKKITLKVTQPHKTFLQQHDIVKIVVYNRYSTTSKPAIGYIQGTGLQSGAIASSVAHDAHNIVAIGSSDTSITQAINTLITHKGGICVVRDNQVDILKLPIAGLMSDSPAENVADAYHQLEQQAHTLGITLTSPFMTLSFMTLLVIPSLKISDQGLFDVQHKKFIEQ